MRHGQNLLFSLIGCAVWGLTSHCADPWTYIVGFFGGLATGYAYDIVRLAARGAGR